MSLPRQDRDEMSAAMTQTLCLMVVCCGLLGLTIELASAANPSWWSNSGPNGMPAVAPEYVTNNGVVTQLYIPSPDAVATVGQLKQFTARAVDELNADLAVGAGTNLTAMVSNWAWTYAQSNYSLTNPDPHANAAVTVGQLKYVGNLVWAQLVAGGYTNTVPSWLATNSTDGAAAVVGQVESVFKFDLSQAPLAVSNVNYTIPNPSEIDFTWTLPSENLATSILVRISLDGINWTTVATLAPTSTSFALTGLDPSSSPMAEIVTSNAVGATSELATPNGGVDPLPPTPANFAGTMDGWGNMDLSWAASTGASAYLLERAVVATGIWSTLTNLPAGTTTYQDTSRDYHTGYHYRISAYNDRGTNAPTGELPPSRYVVIPLDPPGSTTMDVPQFINSHGTVVGGGTMRANGQVQSVLLMWENGQTYPIGLDNVNDFNEADVVSGGTSQGATTWTLYGGSNVLITPMDPNDPDMPTNIIPEPGSIFADYDWGPPGINEGPTLLDGGSTAYSSVVGYYQPQDFYMRDVTPYGALMLTAEWPSPSSVTTVDQPTGAIGYFNDDDGTFYPITNFPPGINYNLTGGNGNGTFTGTYIDTTSGSIGNLIFNGSPIEIPSTTTLGPINSAGEVLGYDTIANALVGLNGSIQPDSTAKIAWSVGAFQSSWNSHGQLVCGNVMWEPSATAGQNGTVFNLNDLLPMGGGWKGVSIITGGIRNINDAGEIAAGATYVGTSTSIIAGAQGVMLLPAELAVDANRDGTIVMANDANNPANAGLPVDTTSAAKPFRFWLNEDQDDTDAAFPGETENLAPYNGATAPYNSPSSYTPDYTLGTIHTKRNLEDFARLWIYTGGLQSAIQAGTIQVALKWATVTSGSPAINVYKAVESDGGSKYLTGDSATDPTADTTAAAQIADDDHNLTKGKITGTSPIVLDKSLFSNLSSTNSKTYCLFEGAGVGSGQLVMVFEDANGNVIGQGGSVWLDIRHVTDMYEQVQGKALTEPLPVPTPEDTTQTVAAEQNVQTTPGPLAAYTSNFTPDPNETSDTIVWVHGWNVYPERYEQQTQAMFKRLWWAGFKGRFAAFRWPSTDGEVDQWPGPIRTLVNGLVFDQIEYRAYKYAGALNTYISQKAANGGHVIVIGHSLGAAITSEALRRGAPMSKLELMDSAESASCFDANTADYASVAAASDPDLSFHTDGTVNGGYRGYFQNLPAGIISSFFNTADSGVYWWTVNNSLFKGAGAYPGDPPTQYSAGSYFYNPSNGDYSPTDTVFSWAFLNIHDNTTRYVRVVPDIHESMAWVAFSRSGPLGYEPTITGPVGININMQAITFFGGSEEGHSPQMDENIQHHVIPFFQALMTQANLNPSNL